MSYRSNRALRRLQSETCAISLVLSVPLLVDEAKIRILDSGIVGLPELARHELAAIDLTHGAGFTAVDG